MTSHDVVAQVRRASGEKKIGHAGTLDPLASGVLILCVGAATRLSDYVMHATKRYRARVRLGAVTTTYDAEGEVVQERDASQITQEQVEQTLGAFLGQIKQIPPMYSAIKQGGKRLYEIARAGETVEREPRKVQIEALSLSEWTLIDVHGLSDRKVPEFTLDVTCSAGTYIRSLAFDIGEALGVGAYLAGLRRTASGRFTLENAVSLDTLLIDPASHLIAPRVALADYPSLLLDAAAENDITHGRSVASDLSDGVTAMAYSAADENRLIAVVQAEHGRLKPQKVFS